ncbi:hypothetical protein [Endozoicomonas sp. ALE010]|uniref:hypothetical protein n=1 Tax=Endozoicomonas sp. ALE010 TaxID=3403081 RepID=UPI003BB5BC90
MCEKVSEIKAVFDQPVTFQLSFKTSDGKYQSIRHTPDAFRVAEHGVKFIECKRVEELLELSKKYPDRYIYDEKEQCFRSPVMERKLDGTGIGYVYFTDADCNPRFLANIRHLMDYLRNSKQKDIPTEMEQQCINFITNSPVMEIGELLRHHPQLKADNILQMVAGRRIFVDLENDLLSDLETCKLFTSEASCQVYSLTRDAKPSNNSQFLSSINIPISKGMICRHGEQQWLLQSIEPVKQTVLVEITGGKKTQLKPFKLEDVRGLIQSRELSVVHYEQEEDVHTSLMLSASEDNQKRALKRHAALNQLIAGDINRHQAAQYLGCSTRTIRRYLQRHGEGVTRRGNGLPELVDKNQEKGNSERVIGGRSLELANDVIDSEYLSAKNKNVAAIHRDYVRLCKDEHIESGSYSWLRRLIKLVDLGKRVREREGHKKFKAMMPITTSDGVIESRRGARAYEYVHIDHTQLDQALKFPNMKPAKPWLTVASDSYSRDVLAVYLTMNSPSIYSVLMVVRELIQRHGRFPESFCVDGGAEFESVVFEQLCAFFSVTIHSRKSNPRGGSAVESVFKQLNEAVIHGLTGNTKLMKNPRQLTSKVNPFQNALWDFQSLKQLLEDYFYEHYNKTEHPAHMLIPDDVLAESLILHGDRDNRKIDINDEHLQIMMLPYDKHKRTRIIQPVKGVERKGKYYGHDLFSSPEWLGREVEIRIDPEDDSYVYCNLNGWKRCKRVAVEDRYYPGIDRSVITEASSFTRSFHSQKARAERAVPINRKIADKERELKEQQEDEMAKPSKSKTGKRVPSLRIEPGVNDIDDF